MEELIQKRCASVSAIASRLKRVIAERARRVFAVPACLVPEIIRAAAESGIYLVDEPVLACGLVELLWYLREQGISWDYHRYGNLGARGGGATTGAELTVNGSGLPRLARAQFLS